MAERIFTMRSVNNKTMCEGDESLIDENKLFFLKRIVINKEKPFSKLTPKFNKICNEKSNINYIRDCAELLLSHMYRGKQVHWDDPEIPVVLW